MRPIIFLAAVVLLFVGCDKDDCRMVENLTIRLTSRAVDQDFDARSGRVTFFIFDKNHRLVDTVTTGVDQRVDLITNRGDRLVVVCVGVPAGSTPWSLPLGTPIDRAMLTLAHSTIHGQMVAVAPGDILMGTIRVPEDVDNETFVQTVWLGRKVASLSVVTQNLRSQLGTPDTDFSYVVRQTFSELSFTGKLSGDKVAYVPISHFSGSTGNFIAPPSYTYPSVESDNFAIDIYKGEMLIRSYPISGEEFPFFLQQGRHTSVWIDFRADSPSGQAGELALTIRTSDWNEQAIGQ